MPRTVIDGERKARLVRVDASTLMFTGLLTRSEWSSLPATPGQTLVTQRAFMGAMLHDESLQGQYPTVGHRFPAALMRKRSGQTRTGRAMSRHLDAIAAQRKAEREYARILQNARKVVL